MLPLYIAAGVFLLFFCFIFVSAMRFFMVACRRESQKTAEKADERYFEALEKSNYAARIPDIKAGRAWLTSTPHENVYVNATDGVTLRARLYENKSSGTNEAATATVVLIHGHRSSGDSDFALTSKFIFNLGYNLLIIDQRAHGKSEGRYITFGALESDDVAIWVRYLAEKYGAGHKLILYGVSMGASTALLTAARYGGVGSSGVSGVIADCGYVSALDEFAYLLRTKYHLPARPVLAFAGILCRIVGGFNLANINVTDAVSVIKCPVLFIHGDSDRYIPVDYTLDNYEACSSQKDLLIVNGAGHATSVLADTPVYFAKLKEFLAEL